MLRMILPFKRFRILILPALTLALVAAAFFFTRHQQPVPVASAAINSHQSIDLGAGYRLETDAQSGQIIAPETILKAAPQPAVAQHQSIDLGAGYRLETDAQSGQILAPVVVLKAQPVDYDQTMDLGAGYKLVLNAEGGQIVAPAVVLKAQPQPTVLEKFDLCSGYWLILTTDGGQIVQERSW
jgi:hypothetical protein